jgi:hypothetical protein
VIRGPGRSGSGRRWPRAEQTAAQAAQAEEAKVAARRARVRESEERVAKQRDAAMARWEDYQRRRADAEAQGSPPPTGRPPDQAYRTRRALARLASTGRGWPRPKRPQPWLCMIRWLT